MTKAGIYANVFSHRDALSLGNLLIATIRKLMEIQELTSIIKRKWQTVLVFALVLGGLAFIVSVFLPQKFRADERLLLVQSHSADVDPYAATRSTEYLTGLFTEIMYSEKFVQQVVQSGFGVTQATFPSEAKEKREFWKKTLRVREKGDTGIIEISVYHQDKYLAEQLALAIGSVITNQHGEYHSRGNAVQIQTIDPVTVTEKPVEPSVPLNTLAGLGLGMIAGLAFIYLFPKKEVNFFAAYEPYNLVPAEEPNWNNPIAVPEIQPAYESSELQTPIGSKNIPPSNLPIA